MDTYPASKKFEETIDRLYPNEDTGRLAIGIIGLPPAAREPLGDPSTPHAQRVAELREKLESWVHLYADELEEFEGEYDTLRIRSEARAILMALRELHALFPEVVL